MTVVCIWDENYRDRVGQKAGSSHASVMIGNTWEAPLKETMESLVILDYYARLRRAWQHTRSGGRENIRTRRMMEKLGGLFATCLTDETAAYVSPSSQVHGNAVRSLWHDLLRKNRAPDRLMVFPETPDQRQRMLEWWQARRERRQPDDTLPFGNNNCCSTAAKVLIEGFGNQLPIYWRGLSLVRKDWCAADLGTLIYQICRAVDGSRELSWDDFVEEMAENQVIPCESGPFLTTADGGCAGFLTPVLGEEPAQMVDHIFLTDLSGASEERDAADTPHPDTCQIWPEEEHITTENLIP
ncbi:MAG: hypothetical protein MI802_12270 [Desulfobacterales bacterium]|nr:hypothetical protein [Desulfobacterales bacterium]